MISGATGAASTCGSPPGSRSRGDDLHAKLSSGTRGLTSSSSCLPYASFSFPLRAKCSPHLWLSSGLSLSSPLSLYPIHSIFLLFLSFSKYSLLSAPIRQWLGRAGASAGVVRWGEVEGQWGSIYCSIAKIGEVAVGKWREGKGVAMAMGALPWVCSLVLGVGVFASGQWVCWPYLVVE